MSGLSYEKEHTVKYYECDTTKKISIPMLLNVLLHVSGEQGRSIGVSDAVMAEKGLSWIILQTEIKVERLPKAEETVRIVTQAQSYNKFFTYRDFKVYDASGELCVVVNCTFAMMDFVQRKIVRINEELIAPYKADATKKLVRTPKPVPLDKDQAQSLDYRVRYLDIDGNQHVNNAKYLDWFLDTLGLDFIRQHKLKSINVKYEKEVSYGNMIQSLVSKETRSDQSLITSHQIINNGILSCEASMVWEKQV